MGLKIIVIAFFVYGVSGRNVIDHDFLSLEPHNVDTIAPLIVGGEPAVSGEFRGKISIQYSNGTHICGGTLIHASHVLTSAFCVTNEWGEVVHPSTYRLMGDDLTLSVVSGNQNRQLRNATHVFVHPEYNLDRLDHNIAVVRTEPFTVSPTFNPVVRPQDSPPANTQCSIAGWGHIFENGPISFQLMRVDAPVISRAICNSPTSYNGAVRGGMFCAGNMAGGQDSCQRDGGGGLICNDLVYGIVSFGNGCARPNFPGVYTDVAIYNAWIDSIIDWQEGEHEIIPTPTPITSPTPIPTLDPTPDPTFTPTDIPVPTSTDDPTPTPTPTTPTESPGGAAGIVNSIYLFVICISIVFFNN